jgi:hypothetical protein
MYKPYEAERVSPFYSIVTFEGDTIFSYVFNHKKAKEDAKLLNNVYNLGVMKACSLAVNGEEILKALKLMS